MFTSSSESAGQEVPLPPISLFNNLLRREYFLQSASQNPDLHKMVNNSMSLQLPWEDNASALQQWKERQDWISVDRRHHAAAPPGRMDSQRGTWGGGMLPDTRLLVDQLGRGVQSIRRAAVRLGVGHECQLLDVVVVQYLHQGIRSLVLSRRRRQEDGPICFLYQVMFYNLYCFCLLGSKFLSNCICWSTGATCQRYVICLPSMHLSLGRHQRTFKRQRSV